MHINVEYPDVVIDIREIKACVDAGDNVGRVLENYLEEIDRNITIKTFTKEQGVRLLAYLPKGRP